MIRPKRPAKTRPSCDQDANQVATKFLSLTS